MTVPDQSGWLPPSASEPPPQPPSQPVRSSGKATASLVLGIVGIFLCPLVCSVLAIVFGAQAKREIDANPAVGGRGTAQAGFVLGIIGLALTVVWAIVLVAAES